MQSATAITSKTSVPNSQRGRQIVAWAILGLFLSGYFVAPIGALTGPTLGAWLAGTQRPRRGFQWLFLLNAIPALAVHWRWIATGNPATALSNLGWIVLAAALAVVPFLAHRLISPSLTGWLSTLPLPLAAVVVHTAAVQWAPSNIAALFFSAPGNQLSVPFLYTGAFFGIGAATFLRFWFASTILWIWNSGLQSRNVVIGPCVYGAALVTVMAFSLSRRFAGAPLTQNLPASNSFVLLCILAIFLLAVRALRLSQQPRTIADQTLRILRSPSTGRSLELVRRGKREQLVNSNGERFPIRNGIPILLRPEDMTGLNLKYNRLYETIGGFYDDIQRVACALSNFNRDSYVMSYLGFLEVKPGDSVLETSVGTGLNFKYLPRDIHRAGLDLSSEMLVNCQANLRRWHMDADLFLGNAECLPFADSSFDVVFHCGGINFFNDRAKAIREMIRVAKPGSLLLIADETEEHVKSTYERGPVTSFFYRNRKEPVTPPVDLVPPEMLDVHLEILDVVGKNRFYALTFRKPVAAPGSLPI